MDKNAVHDQAPQFNPRSFPGLSIMVRVVGAVFCFFASWGPVFSQTDIPQSPLFATDEILEIRLSGDIRSLMDDRAARFQVSSFNTELSG